MEKAQDMPVNNQFGIHYFLDTLHYRQEDLKIWLPVLKDLRIGWIVLKSEKNRAIPEDFLKSLLKEGITPIIEFNLPLRSNIGTRDLKILLQVYAKWGVKYCVFFDRPNQKDSWTDNNWAQNDLVDRFLDQYIPLAKFALDEGLLPVFPPLEPGGNYWDTAFLRSCIKSLVRREQNQILEDLVLSAYAYTHRHDLNWGKGGPELWPQSKPYITPQGSQDQKGFRIFDWYEAISNALLQKEVPIILFASGLANNPDQTKTTNEEIKKNWFNQKLISLLIHTQQSIDLENEVSIDPVPPTVLACNFWLLASEKGQSEAQHAWYVGTTHQNPYIKEMIETLKQEQKQVQTAFEKQNKSRRSDPKQCLIKHYVLLPDQEYGISDWDFDQIKPLINKSRVTVGFSIDEAILSKKVTLLSDQNYYSNETIRILKKFGCEIEQLQKDGTSIAT
ncbi:MAG: hypothetical protein CVU40_03525 [Chloroflexi bacterium HGW-Chloroflexi-2]|jgi:hypothetical protein|nr:MAG: hypothetical protein CVU40_03525 [Chloroflexi bacterium HGW-Chloroflexi-2]